MITDQLEEIVGPILATTVVSRGSVNALTTQIVDASGNQITSFGGSSSQSTFGSAFPASGTAMGYTDGTNMRPAQVYQIGTDYIQGVSLRGLVGGVSQPLGNSTYPLVVQLAGNTSSTANGTYMTVAPTLSNNQTNSLQLDASANLKNVEQFVAQAEDNTNGVIAYALKPLAVSTYSWSQFKNLQANSTLNVKSTTGNVGAIYCHNIGGASGYFQLHNTATTPGGGAVPIYSFLVPSGGTILVDQEFFGLNGQNFATGIAFAVSSTEITYTADTAGNYSSWVQFK